MTTSIRTSRRRFRHWSEIWWETTYKLRPATRTVYWRMLHRHVLPYFGNHTMGSIDYLEVERFIAKMLRDGMSPKKVRDCVSLHRPPRPRSATPRR